MKILDENGTVEYEQEGHSWTLQFLQYLCQQFNNSVVLTSQVKTIDGVARSVSGGFTATINAAAGDLTKGIVLGTGNAVNSPTDYALQAICTHGSGSNQLSYGSMSFIEALVISSSTAIVLTRQVTNSGVASVTVAEIGLYFSYIYVNPNSYSYCVIRDKLDSPVVITAGSTKTVQYTITEAN
jgi:hypothetical protein